MLHTNIKIESINYEQTLSTVFPVLKEYLEESDSGNPVIVLLKNLDDKALPVLLKIMQYMPNRTKDELITVFLNTYSSKICEKLNGKLSEHLVGKHIHIGNVSITQDQDVFYLHFCNIRCNYSALVRENISGFGSFTLGILAGLGGQRLEQTAINHFWNDENKEKVLNLARTTVAQYGLVMELTDIELTKETVSVGELKTSQDCKLHLSDELQNKILDALVQYLKNTVE